MNTSTNLYTPFLNGASILASPAFTGTPTAPTASGGTNTTQLATTAFVQSAISGLATLASPALTGNPTAPTASPGDNDTSIATTAFVTAALAASGNKVRANGQFNMASPSTTYANNLSFSRTGTGQVTVTLSPSLADAEYDVHVQCLSNPTNHVAAQNIVKSAGSFTLELRDVFTNALTNVTFNLTVIKW